MEGDNNINPLPDISHGKTVIENRIVAPSSSFSSSGSVKSFISSDNKVFFFSFLLFKGEENGIETWGADGKAVYWGSWEA